MAEAEDKVKNLYNTFIQNGYSMEPEEQFRENLKDSKKRKAAYDALVSDGYDMEPFAEFESNIGISTTGPQQPMQSVDEPVITDEQPQGWQPGEQQKIAMSRQLHEIGRRTDAMLEGVREHAQNLSDYYTRNKSFDLGTVESTPVNNVETGELEKTYLTPMGERTTNKGSADNVTREIRREMKTSAFAESVPGQLLSARQELARLKAERERHLGEIRAKEDKESHWYDAIGGVYGSKREHQAYDDSASGYDAAIRAAQERVQQLENRCDQMANGDKFWHDFGRGVGQAVSDISAWDFGATDLTNALTMQKIKQKIDSGIVLSDGEKAAMENQIFTEAVKQSLGDCGRGYRWGNIAGSSLSFMKDFILTGGFTGFEGLAVKGMTKGVVGLGGSITRKAIAREVSKKGLLGFVRENGAKGIIDLTKEQGLRWTVKSLGTTVDDLLVRAPMMTGGIQGMGTASKIIDAHTGHADILDDGELVFEDGQSWSRAAWEQGADQTIENFSEMWGAHLPELTAVTKVFGARNLTAAILRSTREGAGTVLSKTSSFLEKAGINGYFGEVGEEYYGQLWRSMFNLESSRNGSGRNNFMDGQFHGDIWGGMAVSIGMTGVGVTGVQSVTHGGKKIIKSAQYLKYRHDVNKAEAKASAMFTQDEWDGIRVAVDLTDNFNIGDFAEQVFTDQRMSEGQKEAVMDYMEASLKYRGHNLGEMLQGTTDSGDSEISEDIDDSYLDGYNNTTPREMNDAQNMYELQRERLAGTLSEDMIQEYDDDPIGALLRTYEPELRQIAVDYVNAKAVRDGMLRRVNDDIDTRIARSNAVVDSRVNRQSGMIEPATMKVDDRKVYVISGAVTVFDNGGGIDVANSSKDIIVRDAESGKIEFADPSQLASLDEAIDAEQQKQLASQQIMQQATQVAIDSMNGTLSFNPGDTVTINDGGGLTDISIIGPAIDEKSGMPIDGQIVVQFADGSRTVFAKDDLQHFADVANLERLDNFEQDRISRTQEAENAEKSVTSQHGNRPEQDNDGSRYVSGNDSSTVAIDTASGVEGDRDRSDIRVYEEGLASSRDAHSEYSERTRRNAEAERLIGIARQQGQYVERSEFTNLGKKQLKHTGESEVYINQAEDKVYKIKDPTAKSPMKGGVQPEDAIYEHLVHNKYFPETRYQFEGISDDMGDLRVVLSQGYIHAVDNATDEQIEAALAERGLKPEGRYRYGNDEISVTDVTGDNALLGADGKVYFIDPIIDFKKPVREIIGEGVAEAPGSDGKAEGITPNDKPADVELTAIRSGEALKRLPVDEQGQPKYEEADPDTAWDAIVEQAHGDEEIAADVVADIIAERQADFKAAEKVLSKTKEVKPEQRKKGDATPTMEERIAAKEAAKKALAKAQAIRDGAKAALEHWQNIAGTVQRREAERLSAEAAEARRRAEEREEFDRMERELAAQVKLRWEEQKRKMDRRLRETAEKVKDVPASVEILQDMRPQTIDEVAAELLTSTKVLWSDHLSGYRRIKYGVASRTGFGEGERKKLFGLFASAEKGGVSIDRLAEDAMQESCQEYGVPYDNGEALDALLDVISRAETKGDINNYIARRRIEQAEQVWESTHEEERRQYDDWCRDCFGMSGDEYEAYEEELSVRIMDAVENFDEAEYYSNFANEILDQQSKEDEYRRNQAAIARGESQSDGRSDEVLPSAQSTETSGNRTVENTQSEIGIGDRSESSDQTGGISETASSGGVISEYSIGIAGESREVRNLGSGVESEAKESLLPNSSEWHLAEHPMDVPDLLPTQGKSDANIETSERIVSDDKVSDSVSEKQAGSGDSLEELFAEAQGRNKKESLGNRITEAEKDVNTDPTEAQKAAGNYKKGHVQVGAFDVTIEQPVGSVRRGTDASGKSWETVMHNTYGYIRGTQSVDGDHIDVFLSANIDDWNGRRVVIADQYNPDGTFDEHKVLLGFNDMEQAKEAYLSNYEHGWENGRRLVFSSANIDDFEKWIDSSHRKQKPYHEYKIAEKAEVKENTPENTVSETKQEAPTDYTIDTYTTKKNKTYHRVIFPRTDKAVWQERLNIAKKMGGMSVPKGYGFKTREEAESFTKAVADAQPLSLEDMRSATGIEQSETTTQPETAMPVNPSGNKLVTDERYVQLRERMLKKLGGQFNMGIDPEILAIGTEMAVYHIEKGTRKFTAYASAMIADLGDAIRPYLKSFYNAVRDMPEAKGAGLVDDMDSYDDVRLVDTANFDKKAINAFSTAETVVKEQRAEKERKAAEAKIMESRKKKSTKKELEATADGSLFETPIDTRPKYSGEVKLKDGRKAVIIYVTRTGDVIPGVGSTPGLLEYHGQTQDGKSVIFTDDDVIDESHSVTDLTGDSATYHERWIQTDELVEEIGGVIENRVAMLQLDPESVKPLTMKDVKKMAAKYPAIKEISDTDLQELVELAMTQLTRSEAIISMDGTAKQQRAAYDHIVNLYQIQPSLNARDSERLIKQQYSTPTPFGFVMGQFVRAGGKSVGSMLEPSAGNGALTITVHPSLIHVNDIDDARLANLRKIGYGQVTAQDALLPFSGDKVDVVMTNPPFGTVTEKVYDAVFRISSLEGQMAINALEKMKDDGRAAIVIGGNTSYRTNGSMNPKDAAFFGYLYSHYNVADVINISGKALYSRNGTGYDVRMILIDGRKTGEFQRVYPPVRAKARAEQVTTFDELYKRVQDDIQQIQQMGSQFADVQRDPETAADGTASAPVRSGNNRPYTGAGQRPGTTGDAVRDTPRTDSGQPSPANDGGRPVGVDNAESGNAGSIDNVPRPAPQQPRSVGSGSTQNGTGRSGGDGRGAATSRSDRSAERLEVKPDLTTEKVPYPNQSDNGFTLMSVVPAAQAQVLQKSLGEIGDVDQYLVDELGYSSKQELYSYLAAEQIDSVALAIHQMNKGNAFIIGDMTGVGKGRQGAALIRYAVMQGKVPIYFTQKPTLYTDNYRDLCDIGSSDLRPFIIASNAKDANIVDADGNVVHKLPSKKEQERVFKYIMEHGTLPDEYDYVLTTYDQIKNGTADYEQNEDGTWNTVARKHPKKSKGYTTADTNGQTRRDALARLAEGNITILDESHTVGGDSGCGRYMQMLTSQAGGVTFLSATFAKRADNMPIYAQRTAIAEAGVKASELIDAIMKGGVTLQEIMSKQLVESGQMIRRERSFEGVSIDWLNVEDETNARQRAQFNEVAEIFNAIRNFQNDYIKPIISDMNDDAASTGGVVDVTRGTESMGVKNVPFASKMYNLVNQLLFALKVDAVADRVVENLRNGYKPVISFTNTMEGFLSSAPKGVAMDDVPNFSLTLMRALEGVMRYTEKDADENSEGGQISLSQLSTEGHNAYNAIRDKIMNLSADLPISPMDAIRMKIEDAGYSVAEITGRTMQLNRTDDGRYIVEARKDRDKKAAMRDFNSGKLDVLMINKSGSTGISLHASSKFEDQRPRVMVFAQFQSDINDEVQMRGRIDRSGQVTRGRYEYIMSTIPAEQRIQMMFKAKLKSLDANTTSSQKSKFNEMEIVDYLNKYGDEVVWEYMKEHPELEERLGDPLKMLKETNSDEAPKTDEKENTEKKPGCAGLISRYLAFLSVEEQDEIFREITEAYRVKIQLLDDAGENDLEITTMPLRAETQKKQIWHQGENPDSGNAFADNTYVEEVEVDVLKKPMKRAEIEDMTRKLMGDKLSTATEYDQQRYGMKDGELNWGRYADKMIDEINNFFGAKADDAVEKMKEAGEKRITKVYNNTVRYLLKGGEKGEHDYTLKEIEDVAYDATVELRTVEMRKQDRRREEINSVRDRITSLLTNLRAGSIYVVPQDLKQGTAEMFSQTFGTFVGFKFNKSYTLGSSTAIFATLDGRRKVELALSDPAIQTIIQATNIAYRYSPKEINAISMDNWDSKVPTQTRQKRYIITGNLLQALVDTEKGEKTKGNLISYSTIDGETRQGILMGENFKLTDLRNSAPLSSRLAQIREGNAIVSENGDVQIEKVTFGWQHRGDYELRVPKSKQRGGIYTMNPDLLKLVTDHNFITKGNSMVAYVTDANIAKVVDMLSRAPFNLTVLQESQLSNISVEEGAGGLLYRFQDEVEDRIEQMFNDAVNGDLKGKPVSIGQLTSEGRDYLEKLSDMEMKEHVSFVLNPSDLVHIFNRHFGKNEKDGRNIPLTKKDIRMLVEVIYSPDKIIFAKEKDGLERNLFFFLKEDETGSFNLLEVYADRKGNLTSKSFFKSKEGVSQRVISLQNDPTLYVRNGWGNPLDDAKLPIFFEKPTIKDEFNRTGDGSGAYSDEEISYYNDPTSRVLGKNRFSKKRQAEFAERERQRMVTRIQELAARMHLDNIEIVTDASQLEGQRAKAKGFYSKRTGKISIVIPNNVSTIDAEQTLLHEAVAHYGLRKLCGDHFNIFLDNVYQSADESIRRKIAEMAAKNGWDFRTATEEYLAELAEDTEFERARESAGWWTKIKSLFLDMLEKIGFEGFRDRAGVVLSDNELRYLLWRSYENLVAPGHFRNIFGEAKDIAKQFELKVGNYAESGITAEYVADVWVDKQKSLEWLRSVKSKSQANTIQDLNSDKIDQQRMNLADVDYLDLDDVAKIVENFENPPVEDEELYRSGDFSPRDKVLARDIYNRICASGSYQFREAVQDSMLGLRELYSSIVDTRIEEVAGYENAYLYENRMSSTNASDQHEYFIRYMKPLLKEIGRIVGANERKRNELTDYLMAKHGLERNEYMRKEAAAKGKDTDRDFAGLIGLTGEADWQSAEATARKWVADYESSVDTANLWQAINNATKATLEKVYTSGIISTETYEKIRDMYKYYIPLRGWNETTSDEVYGYLTGNNGPTGGSIMKKAGGRVSKADDPIATIGMMADDAIRQGNRNLMKQRFLNFVLNHPSDLVSVNDLWLEYDKVTDEWRPVFADVKDTDSAEEVAQKVEAFEQKMEALHKADPKMYKRGREAQNIPYRVINGNLREHQILIKRNGRTFVATINGNPRAAQAINGLTNPDVDQNGVVGDMLKLGTWINRQLSAFYTTRNPDFVVSNFCRDMLYSNCMTWVKESPRYALLFHMNCGKFSPISPRRALGLRKGLRGGTVYSIGMLLRKWETGTLDKNDKYENLFYEFMKNGGETGYTNVRDIDGHKRTIAAELKKQGNVGREAWTALGMQMDLLNRAVENCARFAAFVTSREFGRSIDRSIYDAKEVSVNFNKKGSGGKMIHANGQTSAGKVGGYIGGGCRILFVFWNAGVQGLTNICRQAKRHPAKFIPAVATMFTLGYIVPILAHIFGSGDDDDKNAYFNLPEYVRRSNICFYAGNRWVTIPLPIEFRAIYGLGELAYSVISGNERYSSTELGYHMAAQVSQILPLDVLEGGGGISPFIPSAFKPFTEAYIMNKGWTGLPVYKDTPFNKNDPEWTKAYASADKHLVDFAKWLNETSGGDDFKKGTIDINPAKIEYLLNGTFGGLFTFPNKSKKAIETAFGNRDFEWKNMPIANRLIKSGDERTSYRKLKNEYFKYKEECENTRRLLRKYENAAEQGIFEYAEKVVFLEKSPEFARLEIFNKYKPMLDACNEAISAETDEQRRVQLENEMYGVMREMVDGLKDPDKYIRNVVQQ